MITHTEATDGHHENQAGNIAGAARAIKNMGFRKLELVNPVPYLTEEARAMACQARDVLERAKVYRTFQAAIARKALIVGTTRRLGSRRGPVMDVRQAARRIAEAAASNRVAILFENEHTGLTNRELEECGLVLTIPTHPAFPSLNLAQSVMIVAYELRRPRVRQKPLPLAENREVQRLFRGIPKALKALGYVRKGDKDLAAEIGRHLKRLVGRAGLTSWELNMLLGLCSWIEKTSGPKAAGRTKPQTPLILIKFINIIEIKEAKPTPATKPYGCSVKCAE
ncbi:MAG: TrmJ/YjtD family RNA methyltransferase [Clostridiales bacterium]|nr:TrmJ/YjtD family RNA methyltransferase [Clostridiales bacterium]